MLHSNNKKVFHINQFKNRKRLDTKTLNVTPKLNKVINLWLKHNNSGYYLVKSDRKTPMSPNNITKFLNKIFIKNADGKKISSSMIRHIIISNDLKGEKTLVQLKKKKTRLRINFSIQKP